MNPSEKKDSTGLGGFKLQPPPSQGGASGSRQPRGRRIRQATETSIGSTSDRSSPAHSDIAMNRERVRNLFQSLHPKDGTLSAAILVPLFRKSNLPTNLLREIWYLSDVNNKGYLNEDEFDLSLKLIAVSQKGMSPSLGAVAEAGADIFPILEGVDMPPISQPPPLASGPDSVWSISSSKKEAYASMFFDLDPEGEFLDGFKARDSFMKSELSVERLGQIWSLVDSHERGKLNLAEFLIAMHLIDVAKSGRLATLPSKIPLELMRSVSQACGVSESTTQHNSNAIENDWAPSNQQLQTVQKSFLELPKAPNGEIFARDCVAYFTNSGLPKETLAKIWELANVRDAEGLTSNEFTVAMLLIHGVLSGKTIPSTLPKPLIEIIQRESNIAPLVVAPFELKDLGIQDVAVRPDLISESIAGDVFDYTPETRARLTTLLNELKEMHISVQSDISDLEKSVFEKRSGLDSLVEEHRDVLQHNFRLRSEKQRLTSEVSLLNEEIEQMESQCQAFQKEEANINSNIEKSSKDSRIELGFLNYNLESAAKCHEEINSLLTQLGQPINPPPPFLM